MCHLRGVRENRRPLLRRSLRNVLPRLHQAACQAVQRVCRKISRSCDAPFRLPGLQIRKRQRNNIVRVRLRVAEWDPEGEPADFGYPWREVDDTIRCVSEDEGVRYHCNDCENEFETPERLVEKVQTNGSAT